MTERPSTPPPSSYPSDTTISAPDYEFVRTLLRKEIGFDLGIDRQYLVVNRLIPIAAIEHRRDRDEPVGNEVLPVAAKVVADFVSQQCLNEFVVRGGDRRVGKAAGGIERQRRVGHASSPTVRSFSRRISSVNGFITYSFAPEVSAVAML